MTFSTSSSDFCIGSDTIRLVMQDHSPAIEFKNQTFNNLWLLCQNCIALADPTHLKQFARISNFLWKGTTFEVIDPIDAYQNNYDAQIELEKKHPTDVFPYRLTDYKIFDLSVMHQPTVVSGNVHYYVFNCSTGIPYRVVCPFPYTAHSTHVHYQILPIKG